MKRLVIILIMVISLFPLSAQNQNPQDDLNIIARACASLGLGFGGEFSIEGNNRLKMTFGFSELRYNPGVEWRSPNYFSAMYGDISYAIMSTPSIKSYLGIGYISSFDFEPIMYVPPISGSSPYLAFIFDFTIFRFLTFEVGYINYCGWLNTFIGNQGIKTYVAYDDSNLVKQYSLIDIAGGIKLGVGIKL